MRWPCGGERFPHGAATAEPCSSCAPGGGLRRAKAARAPAAPTAGKSYFTEPQCGQLFFKLTGRQHRVGFKTVVLTGPAIAHIVSGVRKVSRLDTATSAGRGRSHCFHPMCCACPKETLYSFQSVLSGLLDAGKV